MCEPENLERAQRQLRHLRREGRNYGDPTTLEQYRSERRMLLTLHPELQDELDAEEDAEAYEERRRLNAAAGVF